LVVAGLVVFVVEFCCVGFVVGCACALFTGTLGLVSLAGGLF